MAELATALLEPGGVSVMMAMLKQNNVPFETKTVSVESTTSTITFNVTDSGQVSVTLKLGNQVSGGGENPLLLITPTSPAGSASSGSANTVSNGGGSKRKRCNDDEEDDEPGRKPEGRSSTSKRRRLTLRHRGVPVAEDLVIDDNGDRRYIKIYARPIRPRRQNDTLRDVSWDFRYIDVAGVSNLCPHPIVDFISDRPGSNGCVWLPYLIAGSHRRSYTGVQRERIATARAFRDFPHVHHVCSMHRRVDFMSV